MKRKNKLKLFLACLISVSFMCGIGNIKAKTYNTYKKGDKITVNVNNSTKLNFYVMEDNNDKVVAIYENVLGELIEFGASANGYEGSNAQTKLNDLTSSWNNVIEKRLVKADEIISNTTLSDNFNETFTTPSYLCNGTSYWLLDTYKDSTSVIITPFMVRSWTVFCDLTSASDDTENQVRLTSYIRPVITVSKENVIGGVIEDENDKAWDAFVDAFGKTDIMKTTKESSNIVVSSTDSTLKIKLVYNNNTYESSFTYANGILKYVPSTSSLEDAPLVDSLWIANSLYALCAVKNYDIEKVQAWLEENTNLKIATDGIEFVEKEVNITENGEWGDLNMSSTAFSKFELNIVDGLKTYKPLPLHNGGQTTPNNDSQTTLDDITENPKTGAGLNIVLVIVLLLVGAEIVISAKKKDIFKRI